MLKHLKNGSRDFEGDPIPRYAWCEPYVDGFCYSVTCEDGMKGILVTGGIAGVHEFRPFFPCLKDE